jgi:hypothetical protein
MGTAAQPTRENRTITVDFRNEATYFQQFCCKNPFVRRDLKIAPRKIKHLPHAELPYLIFATEPDGGPWSNPTPQGAQLSRRQGLTPIPPNWSDAA